MKPTCASQQISSYRSYIPIGDLEDAGVLPYSVGLGVHPTHQTGLDILTWRGGRRSAPPPDALGLLDLGNEPGYVLIVRRKCRATRLVGGGLRLRLSILATF